MQYFLSYIAAESGGLPQSWKWGDLSLCPPCSDAYGDMYFIVTVMRCVIIFNKVLCMH